MTGKQILQSFLILVLLIFFVWLAFYFLILALVLGACVTAFLFVRRFLINKGIINPPADYMASPPGSPEEAHVDIIEVEYSELHDSERK